MAIWAARSAADQRSLQVVEIGIARLDPVDQLGVADVAAHHRDVDRHADAEVRAQRRIHRKQRDLEPVVDIDAVADGAVEDRLAVFVLADLQVGRVDGAFDEIAGGIDHVEAQLVALDLAAEQERDVELDVGGLERRAFDVVDPADRVADALRRLEHGRRVHQGVDLAGRPGSRCPR